ATLPCEANARIHGPLGSLSVAVVALESRLHQVQKAQMFDGTRVQNPLGGIGEVPLASGPVALAAIRFGMKKLVARTISLPADVVIEDDKSTFMITMIRVHPIQEELSSRYGTGQPFRRYAGRLAHQKSRDGGACFILFISYLRQVPLQQTNISPEARQRIVPVRLLVFTQRTQEPAQ